MDLFITQGVEIPLSEEDQKAIDRVYKDKIILLLNIV